MPPREELVVRAALDDAALRHHQDLVGVAHGRQPVRDDDRSATRERGFERSLYRDLRLGVEVRGGFVEHDDSRCLEQQRAIAMRCFSPPEKR